MFRLVLLHREQAIPDLTYQLIPYEIAIQCHLAATMIVASIPAFKPFMDRATIGFIGISVPGGSGTYS
jgi:hypothetical protein